MLQHRSSHLLAAISILAPFLAIAMPVPMPADFHTSTILGVSILASVPGPLHLASLNDNASASVSQSSAPSLVASTSTSTAAAVHPFVHFV